MFTDLHCHLLPDLDDGARDLGEAVAMARALVSCGFSAAAPSPHAGRGYPAEPKARERLEQLREELGRQKIGLELFPGAENYLDAELLENELAGRGRHVNETRYLLVETPYETVVPALPDVIFKLRRKGIRPLFAHPERCAEFQEKGRAEAAVNAGALLQLNLGSLWGRYGRSVRKVALRLLEAAK
jgi:protein-tyrosine phosphatase